MYVSFLLNAIITGISYAWQLTKNLSIKFVDVTGLLSVTTKTEISILEAII